MEQILQMIALVAIVIGTAFSVLGVLGYWRLPDVYTQLHATGKVGVFGVVLLLVAAIALPTLGIWRGVVLIGLLLLTGPATSHALSSAAYRLGIPLAQVVRDDLAIQVKKTTKH